MAEKKTDVHLELLLGRRVHGPDGRVVGRLEEFRAERDGESWVVTDFDLGRDALLERLAVRHFGWLPGAKPHGYRARWDQIDISEPRRLRLIVPLEELRLLHRR